MTNISNPLDRFPVVRTRSVEEMRAALAQIYVKSKIEPEGRVRAFDISFNNYQLQHIGLTYVKYGAAVRLGFPETSFFSQKFPIRGKGEIVVGGTAIAITPESGEISSPGTSYATKLSADYEHLILRLDSKALMKKLIAITGASISGGLRMDGVPDYTQPAAQSVRKLFLFLVDAVSDPASPFPALALAELEQALMTSFLCGNRHNYSHLLDRQPPGVASWQVRRVEEYIEANWNQQINVEGIAAVTGASARSIFRAFKQSRGYSPMAFAKQVRLRHAQQLLKSAGPATTVTSIASTCGFSELSRFSKDYRRAFGELPSDVLNGAKGAGLAGH